MKAVLSIVVGVAALAGLLVALETTGALGDGKKVVQAADALECLSSLDCEAEWEYCSSGVCVEKGSCFSAADCYNPENNFPGVDCLGPLSCPNGQCERTCSETDCPSDKPLVECLVSPCDVLSNTCNEKVASCVDDYCGGCNVYAFNEAGYQVCTESSTSCESSSDCNGESEYCSSGVCVEMGVCTTDADCFNPENVYASIECLGFISCMGGQCGRTCGASVCPSGEPPVRCLVSPCEVLNSTCSDEVASCVDNYCGGCNVYAFDEAGSQVCTSSEVLDSKSNDCKSSSECKGELEYCSNGTCVEMGVCASDVDCSNPDNIYPVIECVGPISCMVGLCGRTCGGFTECASSSDCKGETEYCSSGVCVEMGVCSSDADCFNPENMFPVIECVGPISCMEGSCGRTCSESFCPSDKPPVECLESPCDVLSSTCDDKVASCVDDYCGGCNVYAFDEAGFQVCTSSVEVDPLSSGCSSSSECKGELEYCSNGTCVEMGVCASDVDCFNPDNIYPVIECVGPISCMEGLCGRTCGGFTECTSSSDCKGESEYCSSGVCVEMGVCSSDADCFNPENMYPVIECVGPISCMEGSCGRTCSESFCPSDKPPVECLVSPCDVLSSTCDDKVASCVDDYCGGCNVYAFDEAGFQVCTSSVEVDPLSSGCSSSSECKGELEYCSNGTCVEMGVCVSDVDCFNPDNIYAVIECVGPISCMEGLCGRTCGGFTECTSSSDCKGETEYCSSGVCVEMGVCSSDADCFNPENMYPVIECVGPISCSSGHCGRTCSASFCPSDQPPVECLASPCEVLSSTCDDKVASCVDNYCGGCNVYAFDEAGFQVCSSKDGVDTLSKGPSSKGCTSSSDCKKKGKSEYCSSGTCVEMGECASDADCLNPDNVYPVIECFGPISCMEGVCERTCGGITECTTSSDCKGELEYCSSGTCVEMGVCGSDVDCFNPDNIYPVIECVGPISCMEGQCGRTCGGFTECASSSDCKGETEYCSSGVCVEMGVCSSDADCFNPENMYPVIECVGPISCSSGQCGRTCSESFCPSDKPPVECLVSPCDALSSSCDDKVASCVDDYCGGCNVYAFDEAGFQVCTGEETVIGKAGTPCESVNDCAEGEYCSGGTCLEDGFCQNDLDCKNPSNIYALPFCFGAIGCHEGGRCGIECGESPCPDGSPQVNCLANPCLTPPVCKEEWEYCIEDYCKGECGFILLDAAGSEVSCTPL